MSDPAGRASDWIRQQGNALKILADLESTPRRGAAFPTVWEGFGWAHSPVSEQEGERRGATYRRRPVGSSPPYQAARADSSPSHERHSHWLSAWETQVVVLPEGLIVWLKCGRSLSR